MPHNVAHFLSIQGARQPDGSAVRAPVGRRRDGSILYTERSFSELDAESSAAAHYFSELGVSRGTRVLLMVKPGLDLIRIVFALFRMGAVPIVIDPGMGLGRFLKCVRHSEPEVIVGIPVAIWISRLFRSSFSSVRARAMIDRKFARHLHRHFRDGEYPVVQSAAEELAAILFTSGSTGPAKGVLYEHGMFLAQVEAIRQEYQIKPGEVDLPMLPVFALFNPALGMCTVVPEMNPSRPATVDPEKIVRAIQQNGVTNSFGSPALWSKIVRYCETNGVHLPTVKRILMAGAPVPPALMARMKKIIPGGEIYTPYGATEALPVSSISASEILESTAIRTERGGGSCVGRPLRGVDVRVIEPSELPLTKLSDTVEMPVGQIGELIVKGPSVTKGYDRLPEADANSKIMDCESAGCWHRMGDLGKLDEQGRIWFCGRQVERVLAAGGPLYTDCCEAVYNCHERVYRSALIDVGEGIPGIVIEPEATHFPSGETERAEFIRELRELGATTPATSSIERFYFEKSFPVDVRHNAKIHRLSLAKKYQAR